MDIKVIGFYAVILLIVAISYLFLRKTTKGKICFFILVSVLLSLNLLHLNYVRSLPKSSALLVNIGPAVGYAISLMIELIFLLVFSSIWFLVVRRKIKRGKLQP